MIAVGVPLVDDSPVAREPFARLVHFFGELAEALARVRIRADGLVAGELRVGRHLATDGPHLFLDGGAVLGVVEELLDPGRFRDRVHVGVDEQRPEQDTDADVRERAERKLPARRAREGGELSIALLNLRDELADRLVDEREPELLVRHGPSLVSYSGRAVHASRAAIRMRTTANRRRSVSSLKATARD